MKRILRLSRDDRKKPDLIERPDEERLMEDSLCPSGVPAPLGGRARSEVEPDGVGGLPTGSLIGVAGESTKVALFRSFSVRLLLLIAGETGIEFWDAGVIDLPGDFGESDLGSPSSNPFTLPIGDFGDLGELGEAEDCRDEGERGTERLVGFSDVRDNDAADLEVISFLSPVAERAGLLGSS